MGMTNQARIQTKTFTKDLSEHGLINVGKTIINHPPVITLFIGGIHKII